MQFKLKNISVIILLSIILSVKVLYSENNYSGFTYTLSTGQSYVTGFYKDYLKGRSSTGFNTYYNFPLFISNTYFKGGMSFDSYTMKSSSDSTLLQYDFLGGTGVFYSLFSFMDLSAGIDFHGIYSRLSTDDTGRNETTFKPGISYNLGAMTYLGKGIGLCVLSDFRQTKLSGEKFSVFNITAGLTYNYNSYLHELELISRSEKTSAMFNRGLAEFKRKNFNDAKAILNDLYKIDKKYPGLDYYMKKIEEIEVNRASADSFIRQQNYLKAIPYLEGCAPYIKECELQLLSQRKALKGNVPIWESDGIKLYDEKDYRGCIELMERILLVDPENQNANIYLPRAIKRQKAIESLQGR